MARILIVEDEWLVVEDLTLKLERWGHTVVAHASSGTEAVTKAAETEPELVLMDIRLRGDMNGLEAAQQIQDRQPVPVIYLTAHASTLAEQYGREGPAPFVLTKPFSRSQLQAVLRAACGEDNRSPS